MRVIGCVELENIDEGDSQRFWITKGDEEGHRVDRRTGKEDAKCFD